MRRASLTAFCFTLATYIASIITSILTARMLGPEGRGQYAVVFLWATTLAATANLSIGDAAGVSAARSRSGEVGVADIMRRALSTAIATTLALLLPCLALFGLAISQSGVTATPFLYLLAAVTIISTVANTVFYNYQRALDHYIKFNLTRSIVLLLLCLLLPLASWYNRGHLNLDEVLTAFLVAVTAGALICMYGGRDLLRTFRWSKPDARLLASGLAMHGPVLVLMFSSQIDRFAAMYTLPAAEFGLFAAAASVAQPPSALLMITLRSVMIGDRALQDPMARSQRLKHYTWALSLAMLTISPVAALALYYVVPIAFGAEFTAAAKTAVWLVAGYALSPIRVMLLELGRITGRNARAVMIEIVYLVTVLLAILVTNHGAPGPMFALALISGNTIAIIVALSWRHLDNWNSINERATC